MNKYLRNRHYLKEKTVHGTPSLPVSMYHLNYDPDDEQLFGLHWHEEIEITVIQSGAAVYFLDNEEVEVSAGEGVFINANRIHSARPKGNSRFEASVAVFHPRLFKRDINSDSYARFVHPIISREQVVPAKMRSEIGWQAEILRLVSSLDIQNPQSPISSELLATGILFQIWHLLYHNSIADNTTSASSWNASATYQSERIKPVLECIHNRFSEDLSLEELAAIIPVSVGQFCRSFKQITGTTPIRYLLDFRIEECCHLLLSTNKKIEDIAIQTGFSSASHFNKEFRKQKRCTPSEYKNIQRQREFTQRTQSHRDF